MKYNVFVRYEFVVEVEADEPSHAVEIALEDIDYKELIDEGKFTVGDYVDVWDSKTRYIFTHQPSVALADQYEDDLG